MPLTGERTVPGIAEENYWFRRHEAAYLWAAPRVTGRTVLEVGCGEGYGAALLGQHVERVVGLDYDGLTIAHAARTYPSVAFVRGNLAALPVRTASVDTVVTLQVIEHVWDHAQFVRECRRALRPDGLLIVTTPNRITFSPGLDAPINPFHTKEFSANELRVLLTGNGFEVTETHGLHAGPRFDAFDGGHEAFVAAQLAGAPDQWSERLRREVRSVEAADFPVVAAHRVDIDESLDLVLVARPA